MKDSQFAILVVVITAGFHMWFTMLAAIIVLAWPVIKQDIK